MNLQLVDSDPCGRLALAGRLDLNEVAAIETRFLALAVAPRKPVIVDLSRLTYIGSMGVGMLVSASRALANHGAKMIFLDPTEFVERVLTVSGVSKSLAICHGLDEARSLLNS